MYNRVVFVFVFVIFILMTYNHGHQLFIKYPYVDFGIVEEPTEDYSLSKNSSEVIRLGIPKPYLEDAEKRFVESLEKKTGLNIETVSNHPLNQVDELLATGYVDVSLVSSITYVWNLEYLEALVSSHPVKPLQGIIIVPKSSSLKNIFELRDKTIVSTNPLSTAGSIVLEYILKEIGIDMRDFFNIIYIDDYHQAIDAVISGTADAAFINTGQLDLAGRKNPLIIKKVKIIYKSMKLDGNVFVSGKNFDKNSKDKFIKGLIELEQHEPNTLRNLGINRLDRAREKDFETTFRIISEVKGTDEKVQ